MSQFDWKTDEDSIEVWSDVSAENNPTSTNHLQSIYFLAALILCALIAAGGYTLWSRANSNVDLLEQQLANWQDAVASATAGKDKELLTSLLGDTQWAEAEATVRISGARFDRSQFGLSQSDVAPLTETELSNDLLTAVLTTTYSYQHNASTTVDNDSLIELQVVQQLARRNERWQPTVPDSWNARKADAVAPNGIDYLYPVGQHEDIREILAALNRVTSNLCDLNDSYSCLAQLGTAIRTLDFSVHPAALLSPTADALNVDDTAFILLPAPELFGIMHNDAAQRSRSHAYTHALFTHLLSVRQPLEADDFGRNQILVDLLMLRGGATTAIVDRASYAVLAAAPPQLAQIIRSEWDSADFLTRQAILAFIVETTSAAPLAALLDATLTEENLLAQQFAWEAFLERRTVAPVLPVGDGTLLAACSNGANSELLSLSAESNDWQSVYQSPTGLRIVLDQVDDGDLIWIREYGEQENDTRQERRGFLTEQGYVNIYDSADESRVQYWHLDSVAQPVVDGQLNLTIYDARTGRSAQVDVASCVQTGRCNPILAKDATSRLSAWQQKLTTASYRLALNVESRLSLGVIPAATLTLTRADGASLAAFDLDANSFWNSIAWLDDDRFLLRGWSNVNGQPQFWVGSAENRSLKHITINDFASILPPPFYEDLELALTTIEVVGEQVLAVLTPNSSFGDKRRETFVVRYEPNSAELLATLPGQLTVPQPNTANQRYLPLQDYGNGQQNITLFDSASNRWTKRTTVRNDNYYAEPFSSQNEWVALAQGAYIEFLSPQSQASEKLFMDGRSCHDVVWLDK